MSFDLNSIPNFQKWNQGEWRSFFQNIGKLCTEGPLPSQAWDVIESRGFQDLLMRVGVFGNAELFDQTPCLWDREIEQQVGWCSSRRITFPLTTANLTVLATRMLFWPDKVYTRDEFFEEICFIQQGDRDQEDGVLIKTCGEEQGLFFRRVDGRAWFFHDPATLFFKKVYGFTDDVEGRMYAGHAFDRAAQIFEDENTLTKMTREVLAPLLLPPLASIVCSYASNLLIDKHAPEKRELRNLTYGALADRPPLFPSDLVECNALKEISGWIVQYVGENDDG